MKKGKNWAHLIGKLDRPFFIGSLAFAIAFSYAIFSLAKFSGDKLFNQFYYVIPIIFPFVFFVFNRFVNFRELGFTVKIIDFLIVLTAMWRVFGDVPYVSGHSLFLTYSMLTAQKRFDFWLSLTVLVEVGILKIFVWNDYLTFINGIILGTVAGLLTNRVIKKEKG